MPLRETIGSRGGVNVQLPKDQLQHELCHDANIRDPIDLHSIKNHHHIP